MIERAATGPGVSFPLESEEVMSDFIFVLVILGVFGLLALAAKAAEKL